MKCGANDNDCFCGELADVDRPCTPSEETPKVVRVGRLVRNDGKSMDLTLDTVVAIISSLRGRSASPMTDRLIARNIEEFYGL